MKRFLTVIILILVIGTTFPQSTFAAWWNPFSWFGQKVATEQAEIEETTRPVEGTYNIPPVTNPETPAVQEKIVTKTVVVDNPELQKQIDALIKENTSLKQQVDFESKTLVETSVKYNDILGKYNSMINGLPKLESELKILIGATVNPLVDKLNACRTSVGLLTVPRPPIYVPLPTYTTPSYRPLSCTSNTYFNTTYTNCY